MLLLVIVALIATRVFFRTARESGLHAGKAASAPMIGLMIILVANHLLMAALIALLAQIAITDSVRSTIIFLNSLFVVALYLVFLRNNFRSIDTKSL